MPFDKLLPGQNFGAMTRTLSSGGLLINAADHTPGMRIPRHEHASAYLCVVLAGGFELQRPGGDVDCIAGTLVAHPAGDSHANRFGEQFGRCMNIHVGDGWGADRALREWLADPRHVRLGASSPALLRLAREIEANDSAAPLAAGAAALELLAEAMRADEPAAPAPWLRRVIDRLEADLTDAPTLTELAAEVGVHPAHLSRAFRQVRGETVGEYLRRRRVEQAERALAGPRPLAEIAADAGFADQAHFTRVFRRHFGMTPAAPRRANQPRV
jgi:AraC family transcriptional regulator